MPKNLSPLLTEKAAKSGRQFPRLQIWQLCCSGLTVEGEGTASTPLHRIPNEDYDIVGLDRGAAVKEFAAFLENSTYNAKQLQFVNQVVDYLTKNGIMDPSILYEPPFTDFSKDGLDGVFLDDDANKIVEVIRKINSNAAA